MRPWPRLPREAVAAPSLAVFKARLDGALGNLVWWKVSLPMAGGLEWNDLSIRSFPIQTILWLYDFLGNWRGIYVKSPMLQSSSSTLATWLWKRFLSGLFFTKKLIKLVMWSSSAIKIAYNPKESCWCFWGTACALVFPLQSGGWITESLLLLPLVISCLSSLITKQGLLGYVIKSHYLPQTQRSRGGTRWRNSNNIAPMEPPTQLFQGCPRRMVNPSPDVKPTRQVNGGDISHKTLLATGVWDSLLHAGKGILGLGKTFWDV